MNRRNDKKLIIGIAIGAVVVVGIIVGVLVGKSHKDTPYVTTDGTIMVDKGGFVNNGGEMVDDSDGELEILGDETVGDYDSATTSNGENMNNGKGQGNQSDTAGTKGTNTTNPGTPQVITPEGGVISNPAGNATGSGAPSGSTGSSNNNANGNTSNNNSGQNQNSQSVVTGGDNNELIIEDTNTNNDNEPTFSFDASEGKTYETPRIPVN